MRRRQAENAQLPERRQGADRRGAQPASRPTQRFRKQSTARKHRGERDGDPNREPLGSARTLTPKPPGADQAGQSGKGVKTDDSTQGIVRPQSHNP